MRRLRTTGDLLLSIAIIGLAGCATVPTGPSVRVLPGPGKTLEQFQADDTFCRQYAAQEAARTISGEIYGSIVQWRYDVPYLQCMYAKGHQLPVAPALNVIPPPATTPPVSPPASAVPAPPSQTP